MHQGPFHHLTHCRRNQLNNCCSFAFSTVLGLFSFEEIQRVAAVRISDSDKPQIGHVLSSRSSPNERYKDNIILQDVKLRPDSAMNDTHELITDPWLSIQSYKVTYYSDVNN